MAPIYTYHHLQQARTTQPDSLIIIGRERRVEIPRSSERGEGRGVGEQELIILVCITEEADRERERWSRWPWR